MSLLLKRQLPILLFDAKTFLLLLLNVFLFQPLNSLLSINFDTVVLLVKTKITNTLFAPDLKKASLMERIIAVVVSQFYQPARTLYQSLDLQIKQVPCQVDF